MNDAEAGPLLKKMPSGPPAPAPASAASWLEAGDLANEHWPTLLAPAATAVAAAAPQDGGRRRRKKLIEECRYRGCAPCRCAETCPYCCGLPEEYQCWGVEEIGMLPCDVRGCRGHCLCWADDDDGGDEDATDAAAG